ncbi:MAG TPA: hypothetical protein VN903_23860 [Polyangia bacterium]|jgi:hypothetical protein|nr:hypothetical protein [Polyangia bacterium]
MKWFLSLIAAGGLVAIIATSSCGPQKTFCPSNPEFSCFNADGNAVGGAGGSLGKCEGGSVIICSDPAQTVVCKQEDCPAAQ